MISIITPFYQSQKYIEESIKSVLHQNYQDWELLLINDGSKDKSKEIALSFKDKRIRYFEQENKGVSAARNLGLINMKGDYFCFLDADDIIPNNSLESRFKLFDTNPLLTFADGRVKKFDQKMENITKSWTPEFIGNPFKDLISLTGKSFLGLTWMIKRDKEKKYQFNESISHSEDLLFYIELSKDWGNYSFTTETILHYRDTPNSAMSDLKGLEQGYRFIEKKMKRWNEVDKKLLKTYRYKYRRAMFLAYLKATQPFNAIKSIL